MSSREELRERTVALAVFRADQWGAPAVVFQAAGGGFYFTTGEEWAARSYPGAHASDTYIQTVGAE